LALFFRSTPVSKPKTAKIGFVWRDTPLAISNPHSAIRNPQLRSLRPPRLGSFSPGTPIFSPKTTIWIHSTALRTPAAIGFVWHE
jgi:hypothetical protein